MQKALKILKILDFLPETYLSEEAKVCPAIKTAG